LAAPGTDRLLDRRPASRLGVHRRSFGPDRIDAAFDLSRQPVAHQTAERDAHRGGVDAENGGAIDQRSGAQRLGVRGRQKPQRDRSRGHGAAPVM